jgi:hypothetical protein
LKKFCIRRENQKRKRKEQKKYKGVAGKPTSLGQKAGPAQQVAHD